MNNSNKNTRNTRKIGKVQRKPRLLHVYSQFVLFLGKLQTHLLSLEPPSFKTYSFEHLLHFEV